MTSDADLKRLLDAYVLHDAREGTHEGEQRLDAYETVKGWTEDNPEQAWCFIELAYQSDISDKDLAVIAAGALEDLLSNHGALIFERLEVALRRARRARFMVAGVWKGGMSNAMWSRFVEMRERFGIQPI